MIRMRVLMVLLRGDRAVTTIYAGVEAVTYLDPDRVLVKCAGQTETFVVGLADVLTITIEPEPYASQA